MQSRHWKWIGLGTLAAIAVGTAVGTAAVARKRRREWRNYDANEIRFRLRDRFTALDDTGADGSGAVRLPRDIAKIEA